MRLLDVTAVHSLVSVGVVMTSVSASTVKAAWVVVVARSYASLVALLLLLAGIAAVVDGHRPQHDRHASSAGDHRGIHDSKVVQDTE